jgi:hypothetical protein
MKAKLLSFVFNNFSESGLFKGLRAKKQKKSLRPSTRVPGCVPTVFKHPFACSSALPPGAGLILPIEIYSTIFCFTQGVVDANRPGPKPTKQRNLAKGFALRK